MKCPVCEAKISEFSLCPTCGFDPGRDYESHPSLTPVEGAKPLSVLRADWGRDLLRCPACGGRTFSFHSGERSVICASCGRPLEKDVLSPFFSQSTPEKAHSVIQVPSLPFSYDDSTRTLTVHGQGPMKNYTLSHAPWFRYRSLIAHVVIEKGVTSVGARAFASCPRLLTVRLPEGLINIGFNAFSGCTELKSIELPNSLSDGLIRIERNAFSGCANLRSIEFPDSLCEIGSYAFEDCFSLTEVRIPSRVSLLSYASFSGCSSLEEIELPDGLKQITSRTFFACKKLRRVTLPSSLLFIEECAFVGCSALEELILPDSVRQIAENAFLGCPKLVLRASEAWRTSHDEVIYSVCSHSEVAFLSL